MKKEELIKKWLNHDLNADEFQAFKKLEDYNEIIKLNRGLQSFKATEFDSSTEFNTLLNEIEKSKRKSSWLKPLLRVAALIAVIVSVYFYKSTSDSEIITKIAEKSHIELPDASQVSLNSKSKISYNKNKWKKERNLTLEGEAFFNVEKGSSFNVITKDGIVTVYGTQFNVKQRENYYEVICYEGLVGVTHNSKTIKLKAGEQFIILNGKVIEKETITGLSPTWINNLSQFKSIPFKEVILEFERQYNVTFKYDNVDIKQLFTGSFSHENMDIALKAITLPLNLKYIKSDQTIILKSD